MLLYTEKVMQQKRHNGAIHSHTKTLLFQSFAAPAPAKSCFSKLPYFLCKVKALCN